MTRVTSVIAAVAAGAVAFSPGSAAAQMHDMHAMQMPGMTMPARPAAKKAALPTPAVVRKAAGKASTRSNSRAEPPRKMAKATKTNASSPLPDGMSGEAPKSGMAMGGMTMPGMDMTATAAPCPPDHAAMGHCTPAASPSASMPVGTDQPAGDAPPPAPPTTLAAARFYDPATMAHANQMMRDEHGGMRFSQILFNLAEVQVRDGRDGYRWDGEGWFGGDIDRFVVKIEGEGGFGDRVESAEVQALYARAIDPYWNVQAGVRQDLGAGARRTYATVGIEGLAPYWFDVEGSLFLSNTGDLLARAEAWYDQRVTQRLILQPRVELNLAAQDVPASHIGAGLSSAELGLRLRYEVAREFAPYVGLSWNHDTVPRQNGASKRDSNSGLALALGIRGWF